MERVAAPFRLCKGVVNNFRDFHTLGCMKCTHFVCAYRSHFNELADVHRKICESGVFNSRIVNYFDWFYGVRLHATESHLIRPSAGLKFCQIPKRFKLIYRLFSKLRFTQSFIDSPSFFFFSNLVFTPFFCSLQLIDKSIKFSC